MRVLTLGGGGMRAIFQLPVLEALMARESYDLILGISAGAINGVFAAAGRLDALRQSWAGTRPRGRAAGAFGVTGFYALSRRPWRALYTMDPLRERLVHALGHADLRVPFGCGVVVRETNEYATLRSESVAGDKGLYAAVMASAAVSGLMSPVNVRARDGTWTLVDGGHRHTLPPLPPQIQWRDVSQLDAITCSPFGLETQPQRPLLHHSIAWTYETQMAAVKALDFERLRRLAQGGTRVRLWVPPRPTGRLLDAHPETMAQRLAMGREVIDRPLVL